jgi:murein DD-endopeptidase MepM/ murein hydrolase activator NlpD
MSEFGAYKLARLSARLAATGLLGAWLAGCSSDSTRFSEAFSLSDGAPTPSVSVGAAAAPSPNARFSAAAHPSPVAVAALPAPAPATTGSIKPTTTQPITGFNGGWSTVGGSPIVLADGEDIEVISRRYGVPSAALLQANGFSNASQVHPGTRLIVPVYNAGGAKSAADEPKKHSVDAEETKSAKTKPEKSAKASKHSDKEADAAEPKKHEKAKTGEAKPGKADKPEKSARADKVEKPEKSAKADKAEKPEKSAKTDKVETQDKSAKAEQPKKQTEAKLDPSAKKPVDQTPTGSVHPEDANQAAPMTSAQADAAGIAPEFRWPARGRVIQCFKCAGNDGINIAVPEGTSVKAAESGVVAYAGSELKGYGNLILIRHPNGFVSAYANNSELDVKRGDQVKRGQIIAKSGQSGNVSSPQLHFELRKGSTPVDPTSYLAGL